MRIIYKRDGFVVEAGARTPLQIRIHAARQTPDHDDFSCLVHLSPVLHKDLEIYGIDAEQAAALALEFVRSLLAGKTLVDGHGRPVRI